MDGRKRVVVTGMGTINPLGDNLDDFYNNLIKGKSGITKWNSIDTSKLSCKIGGDLGHYDFKASIERLENKIPAELYKKLRKLFKTMTFSNKSSAVTSLMAYCDASLFGAELNPFRISVMVGGHNINTKYLYGQTHQYDEEPEWIDPLCGVEGIDPNIPATISEVLGVQGPTYNLGAACASGNIALRDGFRDIITGECDISVVACPFWDMGEFDIHTMAFLNTLVVEPGFQENPHLASRPFDEKRCGFVASHGAGTIIIEELEHAKKRGAKIYAEILGVSANSNGNHLPIPSEEAQSHLMKSLINQTGIKKEQVDFVSCHATSTPVGDIIELNALKKAFGKHIYNMKLNAPKSMLGHTTWAAPVVETIAGILQMINGKIHASINIDKLAPEVDVDVCKDGPVVHNINIMLKNSFGFGGLNCCSLIKRYEG